MQVQNGAEWTTEAGNKRMHTETLDDNDGRRLKGPEVWDGMSWAERHEFLDKTADLLVLKYLYQQDVLSQDQFEHRVALVKAR